jgi:hypothetical protein
LEPAKNARGKIEDITKEQTPKRCDKRLDKNNVWKIVQKFLHDLYYPIIAKKYGVEN